VSESQIFANALKLTTPAERAAYLDSVCAGNDQLRGEVESLLKAHATNPEFLEEPVGPLGSTVEPTPPSGEFTGPPPVQAAESAGRVIGPYKLIDEIGDGGMGTVYMAQQTEPVRRLVALKVIKPGLDSRQFIARFEAERQALALMDHPNIARVFDAGTTETGRPYFVMELVRGVPLTKYCDDHRLPPKERLKLFIPVCQAIQHAHQKGIIHRDIKPSNVLVALYDGEPVPKVIDFGIAKAAGQQLTEKTLVTSFGAVVGTLEYMSPEQAELNQLDIDTRSDVYSLGVLLYELLTGTTPLDRKRLKDAAMLEMLRVIREDEPPKPSTRLSTMEDTASVAANRGLEPKKLSGLVRGELDWIVMKALEKKRNRRYETANGLAMDLRRYLDGDPVEAGPPSAWYRSGKYARKHAGALATAGLFALVLLLATVSSIWLTIRATRAEAVAKEEGVRARQSAAEAESVLGFFQDKVLAAGRPEGKEGGLGKYVTLRQAVDAAERGIASAFQDRPAVEASVRGVLGETYRYLGELDQAIRQLERALDLRKHTLGADHPATLTTQESLAYTYGMAGRLDKSEPLAEQTVAARKARLGPDHPDTLTSQNTLALMYQETGQLDRAIRLFEETLARRIASSGSDHPATLLTQNDLGGAFLYSEKYEQAIPLFERTLEARRAVLGPNHPDTLVTESDLALAYSGDGQPNRAIPLLERSLDTNRAKLGPDHFETLTNQSNLASVCRDAGLLDRAASLLEESLKNKKNELGPGHAKFLHAQCQLGITYRAKGLVDQAVATLEETLRDYRSRFGSDYIFALGCQRELAVACRERGEPVRAESLLREAATLIRGKLGSEHPDLADALAELGLVLMQASRWVEAEPILRECLKIREARLREKWPRFDAMSLLGGSLLGQRKYAEAEPLLVRGYERTNARRDRVPFPDRERIAEAGKRVVQLYEAWGNTDKAAEWRARLATAGGSSRGKPHESESRNRQP
jgi:serine/threonine protein kinase/lipopolysaccharide biosynthesis regulator YciM